MLYNFDWLNVGEAFPPEAEASRIERYKQNRDLFNLEHFAESSLRSRSETCDVPVAVYAQCAQRISQVVGNFEEVISFPVLLGYQRLMSLKMADLVCGEYPTITGGDDEASDHIGEVRDSVNFDDRLYSTVIDLSRYGDAIWRMYKDEDDGHNTFTCWTPTQWFPVVKQDGTNTVQAHCLCWRENVSDDSLNPDWRLHVQIHGCSKADYGHYEAREYRMHTDGTTIAELVSTESVVTGFNACAVMHLKAFSVSDSIYGYDDYMPIDSILAEIMVRIGQISAILDKHAEPNMSGPVSMLSVNPETGERYLQTGKFFATSPGENAPSYLTWDGQLDAAFKQLEFLIDQLYILSEMGAAILGGQEGSATAISGSAMRFKMVNPLAKARRIANSLSVSVRRLFANLCTDTKITMANVAVKWSDGLPDDPRETIENVKLITGETSLMPLEKAIVEFFNKSPAEARSWLEEINKRAAEKIPVEDPNKPGPQDGTGVNPAKKGSTTGLSNFHGLNNGE